MMEPVASIPAPDLGLVPDHQLAELGRHANRQGRPRTEAPAFTERETSSDQLAELATNVRELRAELATLRADLLPVLTLFSRLQQIPRVAKELGKLNG